MIRNPAHVIQQITAYNRTVLRLSEQLGREPTDQEVAVELNVDINKIANYKKWKRETVSLDTKLDDESDDSVVDLVADDKPLPSEVAIEEDNNRIIQEVMSSLDTRTEIIMRLRYGLGKPTRSETIELIKTKGWDTIKDEDFDEQNTLEVIGEKIHLTRERVRQIEKKTLAELQSNKKLQSIK
jgi:RNA polymerase primary sigma factor